MKLERFLILTYGFTVCFVSLALFVGTLAAVMIKIGGLASTDRKSEPALDALASSPVDSRKVYLDESDNPIAPPAGYELEPQPGKAKPLAVASFENGVSDFEARLQLLRRGEQLGRENAQREFSRRANFAQFAVEFTLLLTAAAVFVFHWRWIQRQLATRSAIV
jgi:hypothetical protein